MSRFSRKIWPLILVAGLFACRTAPPLPQVNLAEPGWQVHQGQAVWRPNRESPEIAGELLVATRPDGSAFLQFIKNPFSMVVAQKTRDTWRIQFAQVNKSYSGHGAPPARLMWLQLANWFDGKELPKNYSARRDIPNRWQLENKSTGEMLEGYFNP